MTHRAARVSFTLLVAFPLLALARSAVFAQQASLEAVLAKAAQNAAALSDPSRALVCDEEYEHTYFRRMTNAAVQSERLPLGGHRWVAEKVVLATPDDEKSGLPWTEFRDIVTLDGKPARDGASRLPKLLIEPKSPEVAEALKITHESTNSQSGRLNRTVLLPRLTCVFLHAVNQPRFIFKKGGERTIKGVKTWEVKFQERATPTIVTTSGGQDAPSSGSFWIDPATGRVLSSFLKRYLNRPGSTPRSPSPSRSTRRPISGFRPHSSRGCTTSKTRGNSTGEARSRTGALCRAVSSSSCPCPLRTSTRWRGRTSRQSPRGCSSASASTPRPSG